jgi:hypothetical protein
MTTDVTTDVAKQLNLALEIQRKRDLSATLAKDIVADIRNTLLFQLKWEDLLMAAPIALSSLGAIFVAASSTDTSITLEPPEGGFKQLMYARYTSLWHFDCYLTFNHSYPRLHPNLLECGNLGRLAFMDAEKGMGEISMKAGFTTNIVCKSC